MWERSAHSLVAPQARRPSAIANEARMLRKKRCSRQRTAAATAAWRVGGVERNANANGLRCRVAPELRRLIGEAQARAISHQQRHRSPISSHLTYSSCPTSTSTSTGLDTPACHGTRRGIESSRVLPSRVLSAWERSALGSRRSAAVGTRRRWALGSSGPLVGSDFREASDFRELLPLAPLLAPISSLSCPLLERPASRPASWVLVQQSSSTKHMPGARLRLRLRVVSRLEYSLVALNYARIQTLMATDAERRGSVALLCAFNLWTSGTRLLIPALH